MTSSDVFENRRHKPCILASPLFDVNKAKFPLNGTKFALNRALLAGLQFPSEQVHLCRS